MSESLRHRSGLDPPLEPIDKRDAPRTDGNSAAPSRAVRLLLVTVMTLAFVGFFIGVRHEHTPTLSHIIGSNDEPPEEDSQIIPAMAYGEYNARRLGPNREWQSTLSDLQSPRDPRQWQTTGRTEVHLAARAERRAYDGAPPTVPHPIEQMSSRECLACHAQAQYVGKQRFAPAMSHELMPNCTQCHIEQRSFEFDSPRMVANTFEGTIRPTPGDRAWSAAPPTVPHSLVMRENCLSCHGPAGAHAIRVDHPWDAVCLQCHVPADSPIVRLQFGRPDVLRRLGLLERQVGIEGADEGEGE